MCTEKVTSRISLIHDRLVDALIQHGQQSNFFEKKKNFYQNVPLHMILFIYKINH